MTWELAVVATGIIWRRFPSPMVTTIAEGNSSTAHTSSSEGVSTSVARDDLGWFVGLDRSHVDG
jgi:hypothetical protein